MKTGSKYTVQVTCTAEHKENERGEERGVVRALFRVCCRIIKLQSISYGAFDGFLTNDCELYGSGRTRVCVGIYLRVC